MFGELSSDWIGWQMSIEILGPERSEMMVTPIDGRLAIVMTNAIAAASRLIEARLIASEVPIAP